MNNKVYKRSLYYSYLTLFVLAISQILLVPQILKYTSETEYGIYVIFLTIITGFTNIIGWLGASSIRLLSEHYHNNEIDKFNALYSLLKISFFIYSIVVLLLFYILNKVYINNFLLINNLEPLSLSITSIIFLFILINVAIESNIISAITRLDLLNKYKFYASILALTTSLILLYLFRDSSVIFLSNSLSILLVYFLIKSFLNKNNFNIKITKYWYFKKEDIKKIFIDIGGKAFVYSLLRYLLLADPLVLSFLIEKEDIATYSYYWLPANYLIIILWKFSENAQPYFMKNFSLKNNQLNEVLYDNIFNKTLIFSILASIGYFLIFPYFVYYWVDLKEVDLFALIIYSLTIITLSIYRLDLAVLYSNINYKALIKITFYELCIKYLFVFIFYTQFGFFVSVFGHLVAQLLFVMWYVKQLSQKEIKGNL